MEIGTALREVTLRDVPVASALWSLRVLPARLRGKRRRARRTDHWSISFVSLGGVVLEERPGLLVAGVAGRFWQLSGDLERFATPEAFRGYEPDSSCKAVVDFVWEDGRLATTTRVHVPDPAARRASAATGSSCGPSAARCAVRSSVPSSEGRRPPLSTDPYVLPPNLPVPEDDGAADHLPGLRLPRSCSSPRGAGRPRRARGRPAVLYVYPRAGRPGRPSLPGWDEIPGARGCTPQSCAFRDHEAELRELGARVAGLSAQSLDDQVEFAERNHIAYPVIADPERRLGAALGLPTFEVAGETLYKRLALVAEPGEIVKVFYPVFPPDRNAGRRRRLAARSSIGDAAGDVRGGRDGRVEGDEIVVPRRRRRCASSSSAAAPPTTGGGWPLAGRALRAPIVPKKFFHTAGNFREHEEESKRVGWSHEIAPWIVFFQNVDAIVGPDDPVVYPEHLTEELDYELELAVVISQAGKWFSPEEAPDYIGGYVIFNDITARDIQRREMESGVFSFCKAIDTFCPLGPWIVTPDEIPDPHDLAMELRVNGESRQESHSGRMSVTIPEILSHYSALGYSAGDVVSTGTVSGVAGFSEDAASLYLRPGDVMEAEIERIGVLRNPVISWEDAHGEPAPERVRW